MTILAVFLALAGCGEPPAEAYQVSGRVIHAGTGVDISNVNVIAISSKSRSQTTAVRLRSLDFPARQACTFSRKGGVFRRTLWKFRGKQLI